MIGTLLAKEVRHHRRTAGVTLILSLGLLTTLVAYFIVRDTSSLLQIGAVAARLLAPAYAVLAARRLFVLERREGTWDFLATLPVSPARIVLAKIAVGALFTVGLSVSYLLILALLLHRRELITAGWLTMMCLQVAAYASAWFGIAVLFAQLGRHRIVAWGALLVLIAAAVDYDPRLLRDLSWFDAVWLPIDHTRFAPPIASTVRAALWGLGTCVVAVFVARLGDGLVVQRWYRPMTGRQRSVSIASIVGLVTALTVLTTGTKKTPNYTPLPIVGRVRVAASPGTPLYQLAEELDEELGALEGPLDIAAWPAIVVLRQQTKLPDRIASCTLVGTTIELFVDDSAPPRTMLRQSLRKLLVARTGYLAQADESQAWIANGFAEAWLRRRDRGSASFDARAAWVGRRVARDDLDRWWDLDLRVGGEISDAIAWVGLEVVAEKAGEEAMFALARDVLGGWQPRNSVGLLLRRIGGGVGPIETTIGRTWTEFTDDWIAALRQRARTPIEATVDGSALRVSTSSAAVAIAWSRTSTHAEQIWYAAMPPLAAIPIPATDYDFRPLDGADGVLSVDQDERSRIVVTFARRLDPLQAWIIDGWREVR